MFTSDLEGRFSRLEAQFASMVESVQDHLDAINKNTDELLCCFSFLTELETKLAKLSERLDAVEHVRPATPPHAETLTTAEQEVFLALYVSDVPISIRMTARRLGLSEELIERLVEALALKGVPIDRNYRNQEVYLSVPSRFKQLQAQRNVLGITRQISQQILTHNTQQ
ncbi:MAG: hypothetical protein HC945_03875 [Nitrosarchaeum sp.]|nr:hypothetical protein [Nitrosarchaeum sp.]